MIRSISVKRLFALFAISLTLGFIQVSDTVATVNGTPISKLSFEQRIRFTRWTLGQQLLQIAQQYGEKTLTDPTSPYNAQYKLLTDSHALGQQVLDSLITVQLVNQEAAKRGIAVTDDEVQQQVAAYFGYTLPPAPQDPAAQPTPDPAQVDYETTRDNYFGQVGVAAKMQQADVLATFAEQALQIKVFQAVTGDVPTQAEQIHVRHILVDSEDKANALRTQVKDEASFIELAKTNSLDPVTAVLGGDLGWASRGAYLPEFEAAIWNAKPGELLGPIKTKSGYDLILVLGREIRQLSPSDLARARSITYQQWVQQARTSAAVQIVANWQEFVPNDPTLKEMGLPESK
jgi:parvulin-like peptidyl-prolyl isomerase